MNKAIPDAPHENICYNGRKNLCGERVRIARLRKKLTQEALAARSQVEVVTAESDCISRIEIGTRFAADYELKTLSRILGVTMEWLVEEDADCGRV